MATQRNATEEHRSARGDAARATILRVAAEHFAHDGYNGSSLARIATESGLSQPGLLHHFPSKRALLQAVLDSQGGRSDAREATMVGEGLEILDALIQLVAENSRRLAMVQAFTVLAGEAVGRDHPARQWYIDHYRGNSAALAAALRKGVDTGDIRSGIDCDEVAAEILAVMDGLQIQWLLESERVDMVARFTGYIDRLKQVLRA